MRGRQAARSAVRGGFSRTSVLGLVVGILLVFSLLLLFNRMNLRRGGHGPLTYCTSNLKTIGTAMYTYANENEDFLPIATHAPATDDGRCAVTYAPGKIGRRRGHADDPKAGDTTTDDSELSITRNLWTLIRLNLLTPQTLVCPATPDQPNTEANPQNFWDFADYSEVSYGMQVPYGKHGRPSTAHPDRMVLAADKGPFGAALEAGARNPGVPTLTSSSTPKAWMPWNSPNHKGEGQVVLYANAAVRFEKTPIVGLLNDNIYTRWSDPTGGLGGDENIRVRGTPPTGNEAPFGDTDSLIYP